MTLTQLLIIGLMIRFRPKLATSSTRAATSMGRPQRGDGGLRGRFCGCLALAMLTASVGCSLGKSDKWSFASWDVRKAVGLKGDEKPDPEVPERIVSTWSEAVLNRTGRAPQRGFGGKLAFFKNGSDDPVRVEGQLVVYAFDETDRAPYETEPTRRYVFPTEQLSIYESDTPVGAAYNIWLPWDEVGGTQRKVSLIVRFEPKDGPIIVGEQTKHYLDGPPATPELGGAESALAATSQSAPAAAAPSPAPSAIRQVGFREELPEKQAPMKQANVSNGEVLALTAANRLNTTTIRIPLSLATAPGAPPVRTPAKPVPAASTPPAATDPQGAAAAPGSTGLAAPLQPAPRIQPYIGEPSQARWQYQDPKAGYLPPPTYPISHPLIGGYRPSQPPAPGTEAEQ